MQNAKLSAVRSLADICFLHVSSNSWDKNVCRDRMIGLSTEVARVEEVDGGNFVTKRESDQNARISAIRSLADICFLHVLIRLITCII